MGGSRTIIWIGMFIGSSIGSFIPYLWGGGLMAYTLWGSIGGIAGIWAGFKFGQANGLL